MGRFAKFASRPPVHGRFGGRFGKNPRRRRRRRAARLSAFHHHRAARQVSHRPAAARSQGHHRAARGPLRGPAEILCRPRGPGQNGARGDGAVARPAVRALLRPLCGPGAAQVRAVGVVRALRVQRRGFERGGDFFRKASRPRRAVLADAAVHGLGGVLRRQNHRRLRPAPLRDVRFGVARAADGQAGLQLCARRHPAVVAGRLPLRSPPRRDARRLCRVRKGFAKGRLAGDLRPPPERRPHLPQHGSAAAPGDDHRDATQGRQFCRRPHAGRCCV
mmetsp:Transcript_21872/g.74176  ORF Transcript_21872/g.74176 Transcript_21872/m.74176 type:complete len:276 (+) Transcript_21872:3937-4764(+)